MFKVNCSLFKFFNQVLSTIFTRILLKGFLFVLRVNEGVV